MYRLLLVTLNSDDVLTGILSTDSYENPIMGMNGAYDFINKGHKFEPVDKPDKDCLMIETRGSRRLSYKEVFRNKHQYLFIIEETSEVLTDIYFVFDGFFKQIWKKVQVVVRDFDLI